MKSKLLNKIINTKYLSYWIILAVDLIISVSCTFLACLLARHFTQLEMSGSNMTVYNLINDKAGHFTNPEMSIEVILKIMVLSLICSAISFYIFKAYRNIIRHSTLKELWRLGCATLGKIILIYITLSFYKIISDKQLLIGSLFDLMLTGISLIAVRIAMILMYDILTSKFSKQNSKILIYGINDKSVSLETRLRNSKHYHIAGFYVFGQNYKSYRLADLPVYYFNNEDDFIYITNRYNVEGILFPNYITAQEEKERLIRYCEKNKIKVLIAPPVDEVSGDKLLRANIREIRIEDLLGREEIKINMNEIIANFKDKTILVTGAAGSIGSELCRQLATFGVKQLILFDSAETPMHNIRLELEERFPKMEFVPVIGDVRIAQRVNMVFERYKPQFIFHAAAYKHVPLMEENPCEAVLANVYGTQNVADLAVRYNVEKMVMISTDKAVNPTNVMGASKRLAEIYVQSLGMAIAKGEIEGRTKFVTTRFGNVLGSNGSVIPRFRKQIEKGGPVTVTHPDITRFFMTIPEACRLVMEAATMCNGNEIFVFEMGESVKIADLAKRMIELAGYEPDKEIKIKYTGLRPGEKLYEEVLSNEENTLPTTHQKIKVAKVREYKYANIVPELEHLALAARQIQILETVRLMKQIIPEFKSKNSCFEELDKQKESALSQSNL